MGFPERLRALLAEHGVSQRALARKVPCSTAQVSLLVNGKRQPSPRMAKRIDDILGAGGELTACLQDVLGGDGVLAALVPAGPGMLGAFGPVDATDLGAWAERASTGDGTIGYLAAASRRLTDDYSTGSPLPILAEAMSLQRRVAQILRSGHHRLGHVRDLYVISAELLAFMSSIASDFGQSAAAEAYGHAAWTMADEAAADGVRALALSSLAKAAQWERRYQEAADYARRGLRHSPATSMAVLLACQEAHAWQAAGNVSRAWEALRRAQVARDGITEPDEAGAYRACPRARQANYAIVVHLRAGDVAGALGQVAAADAAYADGDQRAYGTWAQVRIGAAIARARSGDAGGAAHELTPVLRMPAGQRVATITSRLPAVTAALAAQGHTGHDAAVLAERIASFRSAGPGLTMSTPGQE
ncbi:MAG TPA: helix-turn-helix transcriptional regulator [Streptosporangiaceae bacterium]|jgi:hypothetical protein